MLETILDEMKSLASPSVIKRYEKAGEKQAYIGLMMGQISKLAKKYKKEPHLAEELWRTGILDCQLLAIQLFVPKNLNQEKLEELIDENISLSVLDKLVDRVLIKTPHVLALRDKWKENSSTIYQRLAWRLEIFLVSKTKYTENEANDVLDCICRDLVKSPEEIKWVMNQCLVEIAINYPELRQLCLDKAKEMQVYKDMVVAKGCTSAYAPDWIAARLK